MDAEPPLSVIHHANVDPSTNILQNERQVVRKAGRQAIRQFLESHTCFSVIRASGKVLVFDLRIPMQLAFYALVEHDMEVAPLWDAVKCQFVGLLTVTDFIDILRYHRTSNTSVANLSVSSISEMWQKLDLPLQTFTGADSTCTLQQACQQLLANRADFLPIVFADDMRILACITYTDILEHLVRHFREQRRLFDDSITDVGIGTYGSEVVSIQPQQLLADALELMHKHSLSALPVVDAKNKVIGVYSRSDITFLTRARDAEDAVRNLSMTLQEILAQGRTDVTTPDALRTCSAQHTLQSIFESFAQVRFHRLYVVDSEEHLLGVVSACDLVSYFLQGDNEDA